VDDDIGPGFLIHAKDRRLLAQIILFDFRNKNPGATPLFELANDISAQKSGAARDDNAFIFEEIAHLEAPESSLGFPLELEREDFSVGINHPVGEAFKVDLGPLTERIAGF